MAGAAAMAAGASMAAAVSMVVGVAASMVVEAVDFAGAVSPAVDFMEEGWVAACHAASAVAASAVETRREDSVGALLPEVDSAVLEVISPAAILGAAVAQFVAGPR